MEPEFDEQAWDVFLFAAQEAKRLGVDQFDTEHLLLGLAQQDRSAAILNRLEISAERIRAEVERQAPRGPNHLTDNRGLAARRKQAVSFAFEEVCRFGDEFVGPEHLLLGLTQEEAGLGGKILRELAGDPEGLRNLLTQTRTKR
jgi:ATP-dependent Clp protease ATP-binding subunit ClpC